MKLAGIVVLIVASLALGSEAQSPTDPASTKLTERGNLSVSGRDVPYLIRRLPVASFPDLPQKVASQLEKLGCLIPQTYQAHHPENVIHASLERPGSSDWAALCSTDRTVKLMVFFASSSDPSIMASESESARMETHDRTGVLGFAWGIDVASPQQVREAQATMEHHPPLLDHDALADTFVEKSTTYHFFTKNAWNVVDTTD
jgi:hypothetical protein